MTALRPTGFRIRWQVPEWALNSLGTARGGAFLSAAARVTDIIGDALLGDGSGRLRADRPRHRADEITGASADGYEFLRRDHPARHWW